MSELPRVCTQPTVPCKCCGGEAKIFGVVDFNKNCVRTGQVLDFSGIPIYYHRCPACGFIFTVAFDSFSREDFLRWIYNDEYSLVDPDYARQRPAEIAGAIVHLFGAHKHLRILDYGGGNGRTAELLREAGFAEVRAYDPFVPEFADRPTEQYDMVTAIEVVEHSPQPKEIFSDMMRFVKPAGMVFFSTGLLRQEFEPLGLHWWYIAPRNGHVSIYTWPSLVKLSEGLGLNAGTDGFTYHVMCRQPPAFAMHLFQSAPGPA